MVAAEAAACGSPPLVARHSGLAEVAAGLEAEYPPHLSGLASLRPGRRRRPGGDGSRAILALDDGDRAALGAAARRAAVRLWSWEGVAEALVRAGSPPGSGRGG